MTACGLSLNIAPHFLSWVNDCEQRRPVSSISRPRLLFTVKWTLDEMCKSELVFKEYRWNENRSLGSYLSRLLYRNQRFMVDWLGEPALRDFQGGENNNVTESTHSTRPYLSLMRSSLSSTGSAANQRKSHIAAAWTQSMGIL